MHKRLTSAVVSSETANGAVVFIFLVAVAGTIFLGVSGSSSLNLSTIDWRERTLCRAPIRGASEGGEILVARVISELEGRALCEGLSQASALKNHYRAIEVRWEPHAVAAARAITERHAEIMLLRPNAQGVATDFLGSLYAEVAHYPGYDVFLVSNRRRPELTQDSLKDLALGLHAKQESRSGYIVPMALFHELNLPIDALEIRYYPGHAEMRRALEAGEVDAISSYWSDRDRSEHPDWHATRIDQVTEGLNWYLGKDPHQTIPVRCALLDVLRGLADDRTGGYFADLKLREAAYEPCEQD